MWLTARLAMRRPAPLGLITARASCGGAAGAGEAGMSAHRFQQDGIEREYLLYVPRGAPAPSGRPLVLVLHGGGGTHRGMVRLTRRRWNRLADAHGFVVAYPNADRRIWDFGEGVISRNRDRRVDDLAFFRRVIGDVSAAWPIDAARIFAAGMSRGGQASWLCMNAELPKS